MYIYIIYTKRCVKHLLSHFALDRHVPDSQTHNKLAALLKGGEEHSQPATIEVQWHSILMGWLVTGQIPTAGVEIQMFLWVWIPQNRLWFTTKNQQTSGSQWSLLTHTKKSTSCPTLNTFFPMRFLSLTPPAAQKPGGFESHCYPYFCWWNPFKFPFWLLKSQHPILPVWSLNLNVCLIIYNIIIYILIYI